MKFSMEQFTINMDKVLLCRLCLTNSGNSSFVSITPEVEEILRKYNISFEVSPVRRFISLVDDCIIYLTYDSQKRDLSIVDSVSLLTQLCELCWRKIDEFNQFFVQVEKIQANYR